MTAPPMCRECSREVAKVYLRDGAAAAVLIHGDKPCAHVSVCHGIMIIPDPDCPEGYILPYLPHPLVEAAYR